MHTQRQVIDGVEITATTREPLKSTIWVQMPGGEWELLGEVKDLHMRAAGDEPTLIAWGPKPSPEYQCNAVLDVDFFQSSGGAHFVMEERRFAVFNPLQKGEAQWKAERRGRGRR